MRIWVFIFMLLNLPIASAETLLLEIEERKFGKSEILVEIVLPSINQDKNFPSLLLNMVAPWMHGLGSKVRTDEHSKRLLQKAIERFAVAVVDAYTHNIKPNQNIANHTLLTTQRVLLLC